MRRIGFYTILVGVLAFGLACGGGSSSDDRDTGGGGSTTSSTSATQTSYDNATDSLDEIESQSFADQQRRKYGL